MISLTSESLTLKFRYILMGNVVISLKMAGTHVLRWPENQLDGIADGKQIKYLKIKRSFFAFVLEPTKVDSRHHVPTEFQLRSSPVAF